MWQLFFYAWHPLGVREVRAIRQRRPGCRERSRLRRLRPCGLPSLSRGVWGLCPHRPQQGDEPLATPERGKNGLPAADLPSVLCRASSPQPTSSSAPSGHDRRRPGCGPAAQLRPYGRTARFRQARSFEAEATITPRCARRHRVPGKPTNPAHHHKGRRPLHPRVSGGFAPIAPSKGASPLCTPISAGALPPHPRARRWAGGQGAALCWDSVWVAVSVKAEPPAAVAGASLDRTRKEQAPMEKI